MESLICCLLIIHMDRFHKILQFTETLKIFKKRLFGASDYFYISVSKKVRDNQASKKQDHMNKNQQK